MQKGQQQSKASIEQFADQLWRLNNLYEIVDKRGKRIRFKMNWGQERLYEEMALRHIVLKARQIGMSTFLGVLQVDCCVFMPDFQTATLAHDLDSAEKLFFRNIKFPYESLPDGIKDMCPATRDRSRELRFSNGSVVSVVTSARSGTYQLLHVSEFGKLCAKYPDKSREVVTGSFEATPSDGIICIESTAEGQSGYFYDYTMEAKKAKEEGRKLAPLDWRLTFLPWFEHPEYVLNPIGSTISDELRKYFESLETKHGITLSPARKAWYAAKARILLDDMKREYPSTIEEAFEQSLRGTYYLEQMTMVRKQGRICSVPHQAGIRVDTWWDLGIDDAMAIWFVQIVGRETHLIDYLEDSGEGLSYYAEELDRLAKLNRYVYGQHVAPHDIRVRELGTGTTRIETARALGIDFAVAPKMEVADGIQAVRNRLSVCWFDAEKCDKGIRALDAYQKEWDSNRGTYKKTPLHNWASHGADAFRTGVTGDQWHVRPVAQPVRNRSRAFG